MEPEQLSLDLGPGPFCAGCLHRIPCGAAELPEACQPGWESPRRGGVNVLHPSNPATDAHISEVGGVGFDDVTLDRQPSIRLPVVMHQLRPLRGLRGQLDDEVYTAGLEVVRGSVVWPATRFRTFVGLRASQRVGLTLFGDDGYLEAVWPRRLTLVTAIAGAGYDFCVTPSYSNYLDRPRTEFLFNIKRSLAFFALLTHYGVPAVPRVAWIIEHDVRRIATWIQQNPGIHTVALDLSSSTHRDWARELRLFELFDRITGRRLAYFVHGPSTTARCTDLFRIADPNRVCISNSRAIVQPAERGTPFRDRLAAGRCVVESAALAASTLIAV
jgi:hypothetical protein